MKKRAGGYCFSLIIATSCFLFVSMNANAGGTLKTQLNISGTAADSVGNPISGIKAYRVRFYNAAEAGLQLGTDQIGSVTLSAEGVFNIPIDPPLEVATLPDVWYELALDTNDDGIDANDVFAERVPIHGVPFAHNADLLGGQDGSYYLDSANLTGTVPSARLSLTDIDIPDDITIQLASEAQSATQAASATNALLLEGQPGNYYLDSANLTGTSAFNSPEPDRQRHPG